MPILMPENYQAYALAQRAIGGSIDGMGTIRYDATHFVLLADGHEPGSETYKVLFQRIIYYIQAWWSERRKRG